MNDSLALDFDRLETGLARDHAGADDHRGRPGLVLGPDRRLAPAARRRRPGLPRARSASGSPTGCWCSPTRSACCRSIPTRVIALRGLRQRRVQAPGRRSATTIRAEAEVAGAAAARRRARARRARRCRSATTHGRLVAARVDRRALAPRRPARRPPANGAPGASRELSPVERRRGCCSDARGQATADHRGDHPPQHRLRGRPRGAARGRRGRAHRLRARPPADRARGEAAAGAARRARARRQQRGRSRGGGGGARLALGLARRRPARDRARARGRARWLVPGRPATRAPPRPSGPAPTRCRRSLGTWRRCSSAPTAGGDRRARLRRLGRLARLRLDGGGEGGARVDRPLPGARPGAARRSGSTWSRPGRSRPPRPAASPASASSPSAWAQRAPLGWDCADPTPVARAVCFLLSDWSEAISGEILHVDGGFHALGAAALGNGAVEPATAGQSKSS